MTTALFAVFCGFVGLVWSADRFVNGAAATSQHLGMSKLMIGLTVVAFGTSAPELIVSYNASTHAASDMAVGNALGSNMANIGLVLAITALIAAIPIAGSVLRRELPILAAITALAGYALYDSRLDITDGVLLLLSLIIGGYISIQGQRADAKLTANTDEAESEQTLEIEIADTSMRKAAVLVVTGLILLVLSSHVLVWGAKQAATLLGVSQLVIGLTLVAVGTSLPELAASVASAVKGHVDIALGNIVGSNILNIAAVMAIPALLGPVELNKEIFSRDYLFVAVVTLILLLIAIVDNFRKPEQPKLGKLAAALFLTTYCGYYALLFMNN